MRSVTGHGSFAHHPVSLCRRVIPLVLAVMMWGDYGWAQAQPPAPQEPVTLGADRGFGTLANVLGDAPIYLLPDNSRLPLRIAKRGSQVRVIQQSGDWANVQFQDPQYGLRTGYVERRFIRLAPSGTQSQASGAQAPDSTPGVPDAAPVSQASEAQRRSSASGFFAGGGFEWSLLTSNDVTHAAGSESGPGIGLLAGYGFSRVWSLYGGVSFASIDSSTFDGTYALRHVDVGTRIHFAPPGNRVVPFVQLALSRRSLSADYTATQVSHSLDASSPGVSFGGGVNIHINPAVALSAGASWMVGDFNSYELDGKAVSGTSLSAASARVHIGMVWFPD